MKIRQVFVLFLFTAALSPTLTATPATAPGTLVFWTPKPKYPQVAKTARIEGSGVVDVTFDAQGRPTHVEMVQSTGSLILDKNTTMTAEQYWHTSGGRTAAKTIIVDYRLPPLPPAAKPATTVPSRGGSLFFTPHPPYPQSARYAHVSGKLTVRVTYGARGGPVQTEVVTSSGSALLDSYTADYIRLHWKCYNNVATVHTTTLDYVLR